MDKPNGSEILLCIREGKIDDWSSLCLHFSCSPSEHNSQTFWIGEALEKLVRAGLLEINGMLEPSSFVFPQGKIKLTAIATKMQHALGISLPEIAKMKRGSSMIVEPYFGVKNIPDRELSSVFMLMPFDSALLPVYEDHVKKVASKLKLRIKRGDDFFTSHDIMKDIWFSIVRANIIIADCTGRNPNVFYEIGIAHTIGRPIIIITQNEQDVPFDLRAIRYIKYEYTPRGMNRFEEILEASIAELTGK